MTIPTLTRSRSLAPGQGSCVLERWSKKMKLNVRRFLKRGAIVIAALATPVVAFFGLWFASSAGSDRGSPKLASEWSLQLSEFTDPDAAVASNERVWVIRCENGEWMFGLAQGSHGIWRRGGGTVVTKDSNGDLRTYRGHVCWSTGTPFRGTSTEDLATVYQAITDLGFKALSADADGKVTGLQQNAAGQPATRSQSE